MNQIQYLRSNIYAGKGAVKTENAISFDPAILEPELKSLREAIEREMAKTDKGHIALAACSPIEIGLSFRPSDGNQHT